jgi:phage shock protein A
MSPDRHDGWLSNMYEQQARLAEEAVKEVTRLRARIRELEAQIAASPSTLTELQDRVTLLETKMATESSHG